MRMSKLLGEVMNMEESHPGSSPEKVGRSALYGMLFDAQAYVDFAIARLDRAHEICQEDARLPYPIYSVKSRSIVMKMVKNALRQLDSAKDEVADSFNLVKSLDAERL